MPHTFPASPSPDTISDGEDGNQHLYHLQQQHQCEDVRRLLLEAHLRQCALQDGAAWLQQSLSLQAECAHLQQHDATVPSASVIASAMADSWSWQSSQTTPVQRTTHLHTPASAGEESYGLLDTGSSTASFSSVATNGEHMHPHTLLTPAKSSASAAASLVGKLLVPPLWSESSQWPSMLVTSPVTVELLYHLATDLEFESKIAAWSPTFLLRAQLEATERAATNLSFEVPLHCAEIVRKQQLQQFAVAARDASQHHLQQPRPQSQSHVRLLSEQLSWSPASMFESPQQSPHLSGVHSGLASPASGSMTPSPSLSDHRSISVSQRPSINERVRTLTPRATVHPSGQHTQTSCSPMLLSSVGSPQQALMPPPRSRPFSPLALETEAERLAMACSRSGSAPTPAAASPQECAYASHSLPLPLPSSSFRSSKRHRRRSVELMEAERWRCPHANCGRFYRRSSSASIRSHLQNCQHRPIDFDPATAASTSTSIRTRPLAESLAHRVTVSRDQNHTVLSQLVTESRIHAHPGHLSTGRVLSETLGDLMIFRSDPS